ncbi:MAG: AMP-binding protein, partial [Gammaproteobacteria bacterium]|nr:AMP-binding protein [Gammaproteobacteria bacterium]
MNINLGLHLTQRAGLSPDLEAYVEPSTSTRLNYAELNALANRGASVMSGLGLKPGDRAALLMQNCVEFVALFYAAAKLGVVIVPLNTRLTPSELSFILSDSGAKAAFYGVECAELASGIKANKDHPLGIDTWVQVHDGAGEDHHLNALLAQAPDAEPDVVHGGQDNLFIMYTSGTTGLPKGVVHTHETISWAALSWVTTMDVRYKDRLLLPLPMFHVAALTSVISSSVG